MWKDNRDIMNIHIFEYTIEGVAVAGVPAQLTVTIPAGTDHLLKSQAVVNALNANYPSGLLFAVDENSGSLLITSIQGQNFLLKFAATYITAQGGIVERIYTYDEVGFTAQNEELDPKKECTITNGAYNPTAYDTLHDYDELVK
jgi:hypothetical protein